MPEELALNPKESCRVLDLFVSSMFEKSPLAGPTDLVKFCAVCGEYHTDHLERCEACRLTMCSLCYMLPDCPVDHKDTPYHYNIRDNEPDGIDLLRATQRDSDSETLWPKAGMKLWDKLCQKVRVCSDSPIFTYEWGLYTMSAPILAVGVVLALIKMLLSLLVHRKGGDYTGRFRARRTGPDSSARGNSTAHWASGLGGANGCNGCPLFASMMGTTSSPPANRRCGTMG